MYKKCPCCSKEIKSKTSFYQHVKKHSDYIPETVFRIKDRKEMHISYFEIYLKKIHNCKNCGIEYFSKDKKSIFCGHSCSATLTQKGKIISEETKKKTSISLTGRKIKNENEYVKYFHICKNCSNTFISPHKRRATCSKTCLEELNSKNGIINSKRNGGNFSTKIYNFNYKHITVDCDSILEAAAIIYLVDFKNAIHIERCKSILNYYDENNGKNRRFLPDFFVKTLNGITVVEVKSFYKKEMVINDYNKNFSPKKKALSDFCKLRNFEELWLDTNYDINFKKIYRKLCYDRYKKRLNQCNLINQ